MFKTVLFFGVLVSACAASAAEIIKVGIIGLDTSHSIEFAKLLNAETPAPEYAGCRVVAAYPQGSRDIAW